jgi:hypothetical protein
MWHRVDLVLIDVSEEHITSIFRVEGKIRKSASEETVRTGASRQTAKFETTGSALFEENYIVECSTV